MLKARAAPVPPKVAASRDDLLYFLFGGRGHDGGGEGDDLVSALAFTAQSGQRPPSAGFPLGVVADHTKDPFRAAGTQDEPTGAADQMVPAVPFGEEPQPDPA
ncbi:hypothetical protein [Streptomyces sp. NPDC048489]|uniref:hypothetical protein n=1 Tax=Streptomyces sp. NPDC048489 TaxID=3154504 RepID=UPI00341B9C1A